MSNLVAIASMVSENGYGWRRSDRRTDILLDLVYVNLFQSRYDFENKTANTQCSRHITHCFVSIRYNRPYYNRFVCVTQQVFSCDLPMHIFCVDCDFPDVIRQGVNVNMQVYPSVNEYLLRLCSEHMCTQASPGDVVSCPLH